jgi:arylsulfatase A-like enzyme
MDGRSLRGLLEGNRVNWPADRGLLMELRPKCFPYQAIRTRGYLYSRPTPGADATCPAIDELYDLRADPFELDNIADDEMPGAAQTELNERLDSLARCSGIAGRDQPAGVPFCE